MSSANVEWIERQLAPYGPRRSLDELVEELNRIYHASEARDYDRKHTEIFRQLPAIWAELIDAALPGLLNHPLHILDYGCGTGFEAGQLLRKIPRERIASLTCYDLSPQMLDHCRRRIAPLFPAARFTDRWDEIQRTPSPFNLVATNSLLHHLPDIHAALQQVSALLATPATWIAGHEPSCRYYRNRACIDVLAEFERQRRWRRFVTPQSYWNRLRAMVGLRSAPGQDAAQRAFEMGLFARRPPVGLVARLVDFHVPHSPDEAAAGRGLDFKRLAEQLKDSWRLTYVKTYSFMGPFYEGRLPTRWRQECDRLARQHPGDGANFCAVWTRA